MPLHTQKELSDRELLERSRQGDEEAVDRLLTKYKPLVLHLTRARFLIGGDRDDLVQEGMIGLLKAIRDYDPARESRFQTFAALCIDRQMLRAIEASNREKNRPLNDSLRLSGELPVYSAEEEGASPEMAFIDRELKAARLEKLSGKLSALEREVLSGYLSGLSLREIAYKIGKPPKTVDNAFQRIRRKCRNLQDA